MGLCNQGMSRRFDVIWLGDQVFVIRVLGLGFRNWERRSGFEMAGQRPEKPDVSGSTESLSPRFSGMQCLVPHPLNIIFVSTRVWWLTCEHRHLFVPVWWLCFAPAGQSSGPSGPGLPPTVDWSGWSSPHLPADVEALPLLWCHHHPGQAGE